MHELLQPLIDWSIHIMEQMGMLGLFIFSFTESLFHPIPVDPILIAMTAMEKWSIYDLFFWAVLGSVLGGMFAHFLGAHFGKNIFIKFFGKKRFIQGKQFMEKWGIWGILITAVTPIPFKVAAWMAGILHMSRWKFICATIVGRGARFAFILGAFEFFKHYF